MHEPDLPWEWYLGVGQDVIPPDVIHDPAFLQAHGLQAVPGGQGGDLMSSLGPTTSTPPPGSVFAAPPAASPGIAPFAVPAPAPASKANVGILAAIAAAAYFLLFH
jgi:hypothetical protein